jgi:class 3 adenylate cyclase/tetratricopeptide (TPR) repeat protein
MADWQCGSCGGRNPEATRFCGHCGTPAGAPVSDAPATTDADEALRSFITGQVADRLIETGGRLTEERRLVTALFADLSGFTALSERLDAEELLEVIDPIIRALSDIVGRYGGFVEKFAGDALLALFGAPVAHEDDAVRALLVAGEMHRELEHLRERLGTDASGLTLHIGVNTGHGVARMVGSQVRLDYAVLGESVILAQRLESAAPPNETFVGESTHRLTAHRFTFEPVGPLTLKGKSEPVTAWRMTGELAASERAATGVLRRQTPLIGREGELGTLEALLDGLGSGQGATAVVRGDAGVGKSRLTEAVRDRAESRGVRWLEARCLSYGFGLAYWPFIDLLRRVARITVEDAPDVATAKLRDATPDAAAVFGRLLGLPLVDGSETPMEPEAFHRALHAEMATWLRSLASDRPIALAIEDAHWIDGSSLVLLTELVRTLKAAPVLVYVTGRTHEGDPSADPLGQIVVPPDRTAPTTIALEPLPDDQVERLASALLGASPPAPVVTLLAERAAGNPFFAEEIVRSLSDSGAVVRTDGRWQLRPGWEAEVPATIEGVLSARLDAIPRRAVDVLQVAAVIGRRARAALLRAVSDEPELDVSVEQLIQRGLLHATEDSGEPAFVFHHALVLDVAYGRLVRRRRRELHSRAAEAAERLYGTGDDAVELLARHLYLGEGGSKAVDYLIRAGQRARRLFAHDEAIIHFGRAIELASAADVDTDLRRMLPDVQFILAELHEVRGDYDAARELYTAVRDATNDVRAWCGVASTLRRQGRYHEALAAVDDAFASVGGPDLRSLYLERGWSLSMAGTLTEAVVAYRIGLGSGVPEDAMTGRLLVELARAESAAGHIRPARDAVLDALRVLEESEDLRGTAHALRVAGGIHQDFEDYDAAADTLRRGLALAERVGSVEEIGGCLINLGLVERDRRRWEDAIACDRRAIEEFERVGHASGRAIAYGNLAEKLALTGQLDEAERYSLLARDAAAAIGHAMVAAGSIAVLGEIRLAQGRPDEALELAEQAADRYLAAEAGPSAAECYELAARAATAMKDEARAARYAERSRALASAEG